MDGEQKSVVACMKRKRNKTRERATTGEGKTAGWRMRKKIREWDFFGIEKVAFTRWRFRENVRKNGSKKMEEYKRVGEMVVSLRISREG